MPPLVLNVSFNINKYQGISSFALKKHMKYIFFINQEGNPKILLYKNKTRGGHKPNL